MDNQDTNADGAELLEALLQREEAERAARLRKIEERGGIFDASGRFWSIPGKPEIYDEDGNAL